jgi:hypothetical protein
MTIALPGYPLEDFRKVGLGRDFSLSLAYGLSFNGRYLTPFTKVNSVGE